MSAASIVGERYRVERTLGGGGMAIVLLARDEELGRPVAVKLLAEQFAADAELRARFLREARVAARLVHPNVVAVYDAGEADGRPYIVMEYVDGETVADVLERGGRLPADEAVGLVLQASAGLDQAHQSGLVHRDVKPSNLLLARDGVLKVADFGIARALDATKVTETGTILGTATYIAPEQAAGEDVTPAADVYALGAVLYELLTGRPPYGGSLSDLARKQAGDAVTPPRDVVPEIPAPLEETVMRALALRPEQRPQTAGALASELGATPSLETRVVRPARDVRRAPLRRGRLLGVAALAAVLFAVGLAIALRSGGNEQQQHSVARVASIQQGATPEQEARNLAAWLRRYSGP